MYDYRTVCLHSYTSDDDYDCMRRFLAFKRRVDRYERPDAVRQRRYVTVPLIIGGCNCGSRRNDTYNSGEIERRSSHDGDSEIEVEEERVVGRGRKGGGRKVWNGGRKRRKRGEVGRSEDRELVEVKDSNVGNEIVRMNMEAQTLEERKEVKTSTQDFENRIVEDKSNRGIQTMQICCKKDTLMKRILSRCRLEKICCCPSIEQKALCDTEKQTNCEGCVSKTCRTIYEVSQCQPYLLLIFIGICYLFKFFTNCKCK